MEFELDGVKEHLDEEVSSREEVGRQIKKAEGLEMTKMKLSARLTEAESSIENMNSKLHQIEKGRTKLAGEMEEMNHNLDQAQILNNEMDKKAKHFDRIVNEWKKKVDSMSMDLDVSQRDCRNASSELFRVKSAYEESVAQLDEVRRENKSLSNEIKDIMDQISEGGRSIHEIDKIRKRLEAEKLELQAALEEAEGALEQEENKDMQARVDEAQTNALKGGKKAMTRMDTRIRELESEMDAENRRNADSQKNLRKSERKIKELTYSQEED